MNSSFKCECQCICRFSHKCVFQYNAMKCVPGLHKFILKGVGLARNSRCAHTHTPPPPTQCNSTKRIQPADNLLYVVLLRPVNTQCTRCDALFQVITTYILLIEARDMGGQAFGLCNTGTAVIQVEDANDHAPMCEHTTVCVLFCKLVCSMYHIFSPFLISLCVLVSVLLSHCYEFYNDVIKTLGSILNPQWQAT